MKIFCLDDSYSRHVLFRKKFPNDNIIFAISAQEAIGILSEDMSWNLICLDHDLGNEIYVNSDEPNTGYQVAKFLATKNPKCPIVVHSSNYWGAMKMLSCLPHAEYIPYFYQSE